jgi:hypothetical protein
MNITIQEEENYTLAVLNNGVCDAQVALELKEKFNRSFSYLIIDFEYVAEFPEEFMVELSDWNSELESEHILVVAAALDSNAIELFDSYGITGIPTVDESVDFIFMDQLEKELGEELE